LQAVKDLRTAKCAKLAKKPGKYFLASFCGVFFANFAVKSFLGESGELRPVFALRSIALRTAAASFLLAAAILPCAAQTRRAEKRLERQEARQQARGSHAGQWLRRYKDLPPDQQQKALDNDSQFRSLPAERQQRLRERLQRFSSLPPQQQNRILQRMETWEHLTPDQKQQARELYSQLKDLPPERRQKLQIAIRDLRAMPPGQRQQIIESERFKSQFSPQERELLGSASRLPLAPAETGQNESAPEE
jgi:hypothetical protein